MAEINAIFTFTLSEKDECCKTLDKSRDFLTNVLPERGILYFRGISFNITGRNIVLFKYGGKLIGKGIISDVINEKDSSGFYDGYYIVEGDSIEIFNAPITPSILSDYINEDILLKSDKYISLEHLEEINKMIEDYTNGNIVKKEDYNVWSMNISKKEYYDEAWNLFKENECISIDYWISDRDVDYNSFQSIGEIKEFLGDVGSERLKDVEFIDVFVNSIGKGDVFIAHKGQNLISGIGIISSGYIHQKGVLKNVRKVEWVYKEEDIKIRKNSYFSTNTIVKLDKWPYAVNEIICYVAGKNEKFRKNLLDFLFNQFHVNYFNTKEGRNHFKDYDNEKFEITSTWKDINASSSNHVIAEKIWNDIFRREIQVLRVNSRGFLKDRIQKKKGYSDEQMDNLAVNIVKTVNEILSTIDTVKQKEILNEFCERGYDYQIKSGRFTPILYYLDNRFYPINTKTIEVIKFLSPIFGDKINFSKELTEYISNNLIYKSFLEKLNNNVSCYSIDVKVFDQFCHWIYELENYIVENNEIKMFPKKIIENKDDFMDKSKSEYKNVIYFGAPGTGKSHDLNRKVNELLEDFPENYERVTFHPDYSYALFVGTYKPVPKGESDISYEYVEGPFMRSLVKSLKCPKKPFFLIIEEINRANVAAVFGDVFQLLDRNDKGISKFPVNTSKELRKYLKKELEETMKKKFMEDYLYGLLGMDFDKITIPQNMFVWATMNSADQGVFPLDTAFKRRWNFKYIGINDGEDKIKHLKVNLFGKQEFSWNDLRRVINKKLQSYNINEDKFLGPFFAFNECIKEEDKNPKDIIIDDQIFIETFKNKIVMYLFEDAARSHRDDLFKGVSDKKNKTYSEICDAFEKNKKGIRIFHEDIVNIIFSNDGEKENE